MHRASPRRPDEWPMIPVAHLSKRFPLPGGGSLRAVDDLSFAVAPGEIYGLLGPNGAGKTTTLRILVGIPRPTRGSVRVAGLDVMDDPLAVRQRLGFLTNTTGLYPRLS